MNVLRAETKHAADPEEDERELLAALNEADFNVLRMALLQLTGDPALSRMRVTKEPRRGGALMASVLAPEHRSEVEEIALRWWRGLRSVPAHVPSDVEIRRLLETFGGGPLSDDVFRLSAEELALDEFPRDVSWRTKPSPEALADANVVVVGAGFSGIALGAQLVRLGLPFTIIEKLDGIGGTWLRNTYPGVRVDTNCYTYQYKFVKNYPWSEHFPTQAEIKEYLGNVAESFGVSSHIRFRTELVSAKWDDALQRWILQLRNEAGEQEMRCRFLISAAGLFAEPKIPDIEGIEDFEGKLIHSARWDHSYDYRDKRVALIGNGSTGTQLMPGIAAEAKSLAAFQRTPQWIGPMENYRRPISDGLNWLLRNIPFYWNWHSYANFANYYELQLVQEHDEAWKARGGTVSERNDRLRSVLTEYIQTKLAGRPDLIAKSIPSKAPFARRLIVDNGWYDALKRDNVELVTDGIARFSRNGIIDCKGVERVFDLVILSSGFEVSKFFFPTRYEGRSGLTIEEKWGTGGPRAYMTACIPDFPNFFVMYGPSSQGRAGGIPSWMEVWVRYILKAVVATVEAGGTSIGCREDAYRRYNDEIDEAAHSLVWETDGKGSYYVTEQGRSYVNHPWRVDRYHAALVEPDLGDFTIR